jgi:hypothetical protein
MQHDLDVLENKEKGVHHADNGGSRDDGGGDPRRVLFFSEKGKHGRSVASSERSFEWGGFFLI